MKPKRNANADGVPKGLREDLAAFFAVSPTTVEGWRKILKPLAPEGLLQMLGTSKVKNETTQRRLMDPNTLTDLKEIFAEHGLEDRQNLPVPEEILTLDAARLAKIKLETERIQLGLDRDRGEVVSKALLYEAGIRIGAGLAAAVAALDNDLPGLLAGKSEIEIRQAVTPRLARMLEQFREALQEVVEQ